ncbi:MAG: site-2 protease family protein [Desulfobacterales bacterium]
MFNNFDINQFVAFIVPVLFAVTIHEVAHGYVAYRMGDHTAKLAGRLTLNPIKHLDVFGSFLLPLALYLFSSPFIFGYAKPVPVNFANLRHYKKGVILVASAGVLANFGLAAISGGLFQAIAWSQSSWSGTILSPFFRDFLNMAAYSVLINTVLAIFNLVPVPPLDGSKILAVFLPDSLRIYYARTERFGMIIIFFLLITHTLGRFISFFITPLLNFFLGR